jgi:8-oxo-dGTP pyrophosphatase MutT (NUDIX family)
MRKLRSCGRFGAAKLVAVEIDFVKAKLGRHQPERKKEPGVNRAAVAVVLRERLGTTEVLLIERALREGDPWSGHMAFPGGRIEPGDASTRGAASRETFEEVGLALSGADYLGRVADRVGNPRIQSRLIISAHAFHLQEEQAFRLEQSEVQDAFWFPLAEMHADERLIDYAVPQMPKVRFPGILVGEPGRHIVWGLTYGFLEDFFTALGKPLPPRKDNWAEVRGEIESR